MKTCINTIKFVLVLSGAFMLLTYSISLNIENKFLNLDVFWLSNEFAFAIAGGSFASLLVILACEMQKYFLLKRQTEDCIYSQLFALYTQATIIHYNTKRQLNDLSTCVPDNLIDEIADRGLSYLNKLSSIDYVTLYERNVITKVLNQYNGKDGMCIRSFLQNTVFLKIAINEDKISMINQRKNEMITSISPMTHLALTKIFDDSSIILSYIENSIKVIDKECDNRYHWNNVKRQIISYEEDFVSADLNSFLKLPTICFKSEKN